jgi:hypothetical protein
MPCQLCHSSNHTVSQCNGDISAIQFDVVREFIAANPIDLYYQYENLNALSRPALISITSRLGLHCSGTKIVLIQRIIEYYFYQRFIVLSSAGPLISQEETQHAYARLFLWDPPYNSGLSAFRAVMFALLDRYYMRTFDVTGYHLYRIQAAVFANALQLAGPAARQVSVAAAAAAGAGATKAHLKKLQIIVNVDTDLTVKECFMCFEEKPNTRLGCSHEYCVDCVVGTAKARTKSFITCAVCRAEVEEMQVLSADLKTSFLEQIKKE